MPSSITNLQAHAGTDSGPPAVFDWFYEEFLTQVMNTGNLSETLPDEFMKIQTDIDRVAYVMQVRPFMRDFEISDKIGLKSMDKANRYREEGNKLFQSDQAMQSILFYNKALAYAPHPDHDLYPHPEAYRYPPGSNSGGKGVQFQDEAKPGQPKPGQKMVASRYESLSLCYANRSAALRKLCQYDDCLKDISRAARFGYPKENLYKLWERKGKCYQGLKKYELAVKCFRQALVALKESSLSDNQKTLKSQEIQGWIKDLRSTHFFLNFEDGSDMGSDQGSEPPPQLMGATGPIVFVPEPEPKQRKASSMTLPNPEPPASTPEKPLRRSFRRKKTTSQDKPGTPTLGALPSIPSTDGGDNLSLESASNDSPSRPTTSQSTAAASNSPGELVKASSQMSISQISTSSVKPDIEVPDLNYGINPRLPSASNGIDLRFSPDKGRYFVATQDLSPGDVVLREEPYAAVLEAIFRVNHCAYCLKKTATPIPCYECATVQFCCESCRDMSWNEYHSIECGILGYLEPSKYLGKMPHLALRIITKTGMQNLIQQSLVSIPTLKNGEQSTAEAAQNAFFDPTSYRAVHNLATNTDKRSFEDLIKKTSEAIFMSKCLKFNGFFGDKDSATQDTTRVEIFVSSLLLRHLQIAATNGLEMAECILKNNDVTKFDIIPVGGAIFPTMSFFNHSCYANAQRLGYQNFQVVRIVRSVPKGEEVNIDYGFDFYAHPLEARQKRAQTQYHFTCNCKPCRENWPMYNGVANRERKFKVKMTQDVANEVERQAAAYMVGMDLLIKLDIAKALPIFRDYLIVMNDLVEHPDARYIDCEEAYKQCLWLENRGYRLPKATNPNTPTTTPQVVIDHSRYM